MLTPAGSFDTQIETIIMSAFYQGCVHSSTPGLGNATGSIQVLTGTICVLSLTS